MGGSISWRRGKLHEVVKINKGLTLEERVAFLELAVESLQMQKQTTRSGHDFNIRLDNDAEYLTPKEFAAKFAGMTVGYSTMLCRTNQIKHKKIGRRYWIPISALEEFLVPKDERDEWDSPDGGVPLPDNHPEAKQ